MTNERTKTHFIIFAALIVAVGGSLLASRLFQSGEPLEFSSGQQARSDIITITDRTGHDVRLQVPAERIVSCYVAFAEMLAAIGAADAIVGATRDKAKEMGVQSVGTHMSPDIEAIVSCRPDVVIVSSHRKKVVDSLRETLDPTKTSVLAVHPESVAGTLSLIQELGKITGNTSAAHKLVRDAEDRLETIKKKVEAVPKKAYPRVFFEVRSSPSLLTCGNDSVAYDVIRFAGGRPVYNKAGSVVHIDVEHVVDAAPDAYIQQIGVMNPNPVHPNEHSVLSNLDCLDEGRFMQIEEETISRPGPQLIAAVERVYGFLYETSADSSQE